MKKLQNERRLGNSILLIVIAIILTLIVFMLEGCELHSVFNAPDDWAYHEPEPIEIDTVEIDTVVVDTIVVDTLPTDTIIPCTEPIEITQPEFVTLYLEFDFLEDSILWQGGGTSSYDLAEVVQAVTSLPFTIYSKNKSFVVIIDGTNNHQSFQTKIFSRSGGAKFYFGTARQGFEFLGALEFEEYKQVIEKYPSVYFFNFLGTNYDSLQYDELAYKILGTCKKGRWKADFRFNPFEAPDTIINQFEAAKWDIVLH